MRLIDTDTLVKDLSYLYTKNHISVDMRAKEILTTIMEQSTAHSVDKVIEEIEKANQGCCIYCGCDLYSDDVIEIISLQKRGLMCLTLTGCYLLHL